MIRLVLVLGFAYFVAIVLLLVAAHVIVGFTWLFKALGTAMTGIKNRVAVFKREIVKGGVQ